MADINVKSEETSKGWKFDVQVSEGSSQSNHSVTMSQDTYQKLTGAAVSPEVCVPCGISHETARK